MARRPFTLAGLTVLRSIPRHRVVVLFTWIALVWVLAAFFSTLPYPEKFNHPSTINPLNRWDAAYYGAHATNEPSLLRDAFPPLYGWIVKVFMLLTSVSFDIGSIAVSTALTLLGALLVAHLWERHAGLTPKQATFAMTLLLVSPAGFSLLAPYPTSLLIVLAGLSWLGITRRNLWLAILPAIAAPLAHATGLALTFGALIALAAQRDRRKTLIAVIFTAAAGTAAFASGMIERFFRARDGFSSFDGIPFWEKGSWFLRHAPAVVIISVLFTVALIGVTLAYRRQTNLWGATVAIGLLVIGILSGLWGGIPRYLMPMLVIPAAISTLPRFLKIPVLMISLTLEVVWLYQYITWIIYV